MIIYKEYEMDDNNFSDYEEILRKKEKKRLSKIKDNKSDKIEKPKSKELKDYRKLKNGNKYSDYDDNNLDII